mmetsp:Transcript_20318/g.23548  ORF Transcript_20318/g.23548 Transcript_20318/m.23548 type:complete len:223 (-) Transcript_20318:283-951(-)
MYLVCASLCLLGAQLPSNRKKAHFTVRRCGRNSKFNSNVSFFHKWAISFRRRVNLPEITYFVLPVAKNSFSLLTSSLLEMSLNHGFQLCFTFITYKSLRFHNLYVETLGKLIIWVVEITDTTGHTCTYVSSYISKRNDNSTGHVFTAVITGTLGDSKCTTITNSETLSSSSISMEISTSCSIKTGISYNTGFRCDEASVLIWDDNNFSAMHSFSNVVICFSF